MQRCKVPRYTPGFSPSHCYSGGAFADEREERTGGATPHLFNAKRVRGCEGVGSLQEIIGKCNYFEKLLKEIGQIVKQVREPNRKRCVPVIVQVR